MKNKLLPIVLFLTLLGSLPTHAQCTQAIKDSLQSVVEIEYQAVKPVLVDQYKGNWFKLLKNDSTIDSTVKDKLTSFRKNLVSSLTCDVQDSVRQKEIKQREKLMTQHIDSSFLHVEFVNAKYAGSESFSSDIDVNLKGDGTEYAVALINRKFRTEFPLNEEIGELLDINFYAKDFVPKLTKQVRGSVKIIPDEEWREHIFQSSIIQWEDIRFQTKMAHAFMFKNMHKEDIDNYKNSQSPNPLFQAAFEEYETYLHRIEEEQEGTPMAQENRVYEELLITAAQKRIEFEWAKLHANLTLDSIFLEWKNAKTYGTLHANEAHCTEGAIVDVVANKQILSAQFKKNPGQQFQKIELTEHELFHSFTEQIGFLFHKLNNDNPELSDIIKLGKYVHRAYHALKHFYAETNLSPIPEEEKLTPVYSEEERLTGTDWEGLKKGKQRDSNGKFTVPVTAENKQAEMERIIAVFNKVYRDRDLGDSIGEIAKPKELFNNLKRFFLDMKVKVDVQYFGEFSTQYN
ncbi:MAG: hypothetical protein AB8B69_09890 [Chitinophagales bacterium]